MRLCQPKTFLGHGIRVTEDTQQIYVFALTASQLLNICVEQCFEEISNTDMLSITFQTFFPSQKPLTGMAMAGLPLQYPTHRQLICAIQHILSRCSLTDSSILSLVTHTSFTDIFLNYLLLTILSNSPGVHLTFQ